MPVASATFVQKIVVQLAPIEKGVIRNISLPAAFNNFFANDLIPSNPPCIFRCMASISIFGDLLVTINKNNVISTNTLNEVGGPTLNANGVYIFDTLVHAGETINYQFDQTGGTINEFKVQEVDSAGP